MSFFKSAHDLESLESGIRGFHGFKAQSGFDESFEFSMVRFQAIIEVFHLSMLGFWREFPLLLQFLDGCRISGSLIGI